MGVRIGDGGGGDVSAKGLRGRVNGKGRIEAGGKVGKLGGPSARKKRGLQDDKVSGSTRKSRFPSTRSGQALTVPVASFGMTKRVVGVNAAYVNEAGELKLSGKIGERKEFKFSGEFEHVEELKRKFPPKRMGELWELDFLRKAMGMGMIVSKPWGDSYRYDFVVDNDGVLWRVQVRATESRMGTRGYAVHASVYVGKKIVGLTEKDIDFIVAYIANRGIWYVVPVKAFVPRKNLWFYPDGSKKGARFEKYRDAWWEMTGKKE